MGTVVLVLSVLIVGIPKVLTPLSMTSEIQMGLMLVLAIGVLLILLYLMAAGFASWRPDVQNHALGLPPGSVRALIALFLIMIFTIMSVYLYRTVAGVAGSELEDLTLAQVRELGDQVMAIEQDSAGKFDVTLRVPVTAAGEQIALQLITLLGTLVTAVSAFYFGNAAATTRDGSDPPVEEDPQRAAQRVR